MTVHEMTASDVPAIAALMNRVKRWSIEQVTKQLSGERGRYLTDQRGEPVGWLSAIHLPLLRTVEIDTLAFSAADGPTVGPELTPLLEACEAWARANDVVDVRFIIGSQCSCQGRPLGEPWQELRDLRPPENHRQIAWWTEQGYRPHAILPEVYGPGHHGIMLLKHT